MNMLCPTLLLAGEKDRSFAGQAQKLYDLLKCPKKYILFITEEGAEDHCQEALFLANQRIFDWLDEMSLSSIQLMVIAAVAICWWEPNINGLASIQNRFDIYAVECAPNLTHFIHPV
jgi:hypothetical protein